MICLNLDTGQFYPASGTVSVNWANGPYPAPATPITYQVLRVSLWGGLSIGANMDFAAALYVSGNGTFYRVNKDSGPWMPLAYTAFDRYGTSDGQSYQQEWDWDSYGIIVNPNDQIMLQANCVNHGVTNPVFGTPASADNAQAQAYVWLKAVST